MPKTLSYALPARVRSALVLATIVRRGRSEHFSRTPENVVSLGFKHPRTKPLQVRKEILDFAYIVRDRKPKTLLEIGTNTGGTFFVLCQLADPTGTVISLDLPSARFSSLSRTLSQKILLRYMPRRSQKKYFLEGDSHKAASLVRVQEKLLGRKLDLLFIDGDHSYEGVLQDFEMYCPLVSQGGMVAFHDIAEHPKGSGCEVNRFWNEVKRRYPYREIMQDPLQGWAGIGIIYL